MEAFRALCDRWYWAMTRWVAPGLVNAQRTYIKTLDTLVRPGVTWLDLGCGRRLVPAWLPDADRIGSEMIRRAARVVGIDPQCESLADNAQGMCKVVGGAGRLPFPDGAFDLVTANMVVEHLDNPANALREIQRVLRPNGVVLFHTPNLWHPMTLLAATLPQPIKNLLVAFLEGRAADDVFPVRYRLNRQSAVRRHARHLGLHIERIDMIESSPQTVMLGPLVIFEMLLIRATRWPALAPFRNNMLVELRKPDTSADHASPPRGALADCEYIVPPARAA